MKNNWIFLSYENHAELSNYGGSAGMEIEWVRRMDRGDTSNNSFLRFAAHTGTHIDFPLHFYKEGKTGSDYKAADFVMNQAGIIDISSATISDYLIRPEHLKDTEQLNSTIDFLIIKTGFSSKRYLEDYWNYNWGFAPETAAYLRKRFPLLKGIGFDLISLSSYQQRETGRIAHKEFLEKNHLLIVEDMELSEISATTILETCIISPLRFKGADGTPVTIFAQLGK